MNLSLWINEQQENELISRSTIYFIHIFIYIFSTITIILWYSYLFSKKKIKFS